MGALCVSLRKPMTLHQRLQDLGHACRRSLHYADGCTGVFKWQTLYLDHFVRSAGCITTFNCMPRTQSGTNPPATAQEPNMASLQYCMLCDVAVGAGEYAWTQHKATDIHTKQVTSGNVVFA